jgi:hypothetical protein
MALVRRDGRRRASDAGEESRASPGFAPRVLPLGAVAVLYAIRLAAWPTPWGTVTQYAGWGFGLIALVAAAHCLAMLFPRYDFDALAWALTIVVGGLLLVLLAPSGGA